MKKERETLSPRQFIDRERAKHEMVLQRFLARFACYSLAGTCGSALIMFFLQGFRLWGFSLETSLMHWIGGATVGCIGGLTLTVYKSLFPHRQPDRGTPNDQVESSPVPE